MFSRLFEGCTNAMQWGDYGEKICYKNCFFNYINKNEKKI